MTKDETMSWVEEISVAGQPAFCLRNAVGDQVVVLQHGAQILSWMTADGVERLYCTSRLPSEPKPVRGGVPVIFPQFNQRGPDFTLPRHGFARHQPWERLDAVFAASALHGASAPAGDHEAGARVPPPPAAALPAAHVPHDIVGAEDAAAAGLHATDLVLGLHANEATRAAWTHDFSLQLHIRMLPGQLDLQLVLDNLDPQGCAPMHFTAALHTYFAVTELTASQVDGLAGASLTSKGVANLLKFWLGPQGFGPFIAHLKDGSVKVAGTAHPAGTPATARVTAERAATPAGRHDGSTSSGVALPHDLIATAEGGR